MKTIKFLFSIILGLSFLPGLSQELKIIDKDTVILITPDQLAKINSIIADREFALDELDLTQQLVNNLEYTVDLRDSIIEQHSLVILKNEEAYTAHIQDLNSKLEKEEKKSTWLTWGIVGVAGSALGLLLAN